MLSVGQSIRTPQRDIKSSFSCGQVRSIYVAINDNQSPENSLLNYFPGDIQESSPALPTGIILYSKHPVSVFKDSNNTCISYKDQFQLPALNTNFTQAQQYLDWVFHWAPSELSFYNPDSIQEPFTRSCFVAGSRHTAHPVELLIGSNNPLSLLHFLRYLDNKMQLSYFNLNFCCSSKTETIIKAMTQKQGCKYLQMLMFASFLALWKPATRKDYQVLAGLPQVGESKAEQGVLLMRHGVQSFEFALFLPHTAATKGKKSLAS